MHAAHIISFEARNHFYMFQMQEGQFWAVVELLPYQFLPASICIADWAYSLHHCCPKSISSLARLDHVQCQNFSRARDNSPVTSAFQCVCCRLGIRYGPPLSKMHRVCSFHHVRGQELYGESNNHLAALGPGSFCDANRAYNPCRTCLERMHKEFMFSTHTKAKISCRHRTASSSFPGATKCVSTPVCAEQTN